MGVGRGHLEALTGRGVRAGPRAGDPSRAGRGLERRQEVPPDVPLGERVQVAPAQREVLDDRPVQRAALLGEDGQGRVEIVHDSSWARGITLSAKSSTSDQSATLNGSGPAPAMNSSAPAWAKAA